MLIEYEHFAINKRNNSKKFMSYVYRNNSKRASSLSHSLDGAHLYIWQTSEVSFFLSRVAWIPQSVMNWMLYKIRQISTLLLLLLFINMHTFVSDESEFMLWLHNGWHSILLSHPLAVHIRSLQVVFHNNNILRLTMPLIEKNEIYWWWWCTLSSRRGWRWSSNFISCDMELYHAMLIYLLNEANTTASWM